MTIRYVVGDATEPQVDGPKIIAHVCNSWGVWGAGFVLAISRRWTKPEAQYRAWFRGRDGFELGAVRYVEVESDIVVANMIAQNSRVQLPALSDCLLEVADEAFARRASVHMPRIGCGLGGSTWDVVGPLVEAALHDVDVFVYDLPSRPE